MNDLAEWEVAQELNPEEPHSWSETRTGAISNVYLFSYITGTPTKLLLCNSNIWICSTVEESVQDWYEVNEWMNWLVRRLLLTEVLSYLLGWMSEEMSEWTTQGGAAPLLSVSGSIRYDESEWITS